MNDNNLIFVISQPRSGSSMLQQILMQNKSIISFPEPWLMLPLVYIYKYPDSNVGYNPNYANINLLEYLNNFPEGAQKVKEKIRECAFDIYKLSGINKDQFFLDKTPRYYHIIDELFELFPRAKFIFLLRNPASVFSSILSYNFHGNLNDFLKAVDRHDDLYIAPKNILDAKQRKLKNSCFLNYEDIVLFPEKTLKKISEFIGYNYRVTSYQISDKFIDSQRIDTKSVRNHSMPVDTYLNSWKKNINTHREKKGLLKYLNNLGPTVIENLGYDYYEIINEIKQHNVKLFSSFTFRIKGFNK